MRNEKNTYPAPALQETKGSLSFSANIADMRIPFQIIRNCYTKVFEIIQIFENCIFKGKGSLNFIQMFSCQLHLVAFVSQVKL